MILSQAGDMVSKALENVPSDIGVPINQQYAIRRIQALSKDIKTIADFKVTRNGLIKTDPTAEYRLQVTRAVGIALLEFLLKISGGETGVGRARGVS
jgi:hypothetical protein